jgi:plastocyanin
MMSKISAKARHPFLVALLFTSLGFPSAARAEEAAGAPAQVKIDNFAFTPQELTVKAGTKVTFVNHDDIPHSVVSSDGKFHSKALDTDDSFVFTFATPGEFGYFCGLHPHMTAKIVVVP